MSRTRSSTLPQRILSFALLWTSILALGLTAPSPAAKAQGTFSNGGVVSLQGTPHLFIADQIGVLHWAGDTRALQGRFVDWGNRVEVNLDTLKTLRRGDPYLSAGLLKDGEPIYLVKWEISEPSPRLLHIQCIADVELFGINGSNYGNFIVDRPEWERRFRISVSTLQKSELASGSCGGRSPKPLMKAEDLKALEPALRIYGLVPDDVNIARTISLALPQIVRDPDKDPLVLLSAPLVRPPSPATAGTAIGVLQTTRGIPVDGSQNLAPGLYVVAVTGAAGGMGPQSRIVFVPSGTNPREQATSVAPQLRSMRRDVTSPQAIMTIDQLCFSWNHTQVCSTAPSPRRALSGSERNRMGAVMKDTVDKLAAANKLRGVGINLDGTVPDVEGKSAADAKRGSILAAPIDRAPAVVPVAAAGGTGGTEPPGDADVVPVAARLAGVDAVVGAIFVEQTIDIPNYPTVPPGAYAVRAIQTANGQWVAQLDGADGSSLQVEAENVEVLGGIAEPTAVVVNLSLSVPFGNLNLGLCLFREGCE